jgi:amino acid transporter
MPVDVEARRKKIEEKRRRRAKASGIDWTLTNIGAAICLMGMFLFIFIFLNFLLTDRDNILIILAIPGVILLIIGYGLIVKDHFDNKKRRKGKVERKIASEEE